MTILDRPTAFMLDAIEQLSGAHLDLEALLRGFGGAAVPGLACAVIIDLDGHPSWQLGKPLEQASSLVLPIAARGHQLGCVRLVLEQEVEREEIRIIQATVAHLGLAIDAMQRSQWTRERVHERATMLGVLMHDLKSPLGAITMSAELLQRSALTPQQSKSVDLVGRASGRISHLLDELTDFFALERGAFRIAARRANARGIVEQSLEQTRSLATTRQIGLELDIEPDLPAVWADQERAAQVLAGFVDNGLRVTPKGGRVLVSATRSEAGVTFSVADQGPGVDDRELASFFARPRTSTAGYAGAGLGLAVARGIVDAHGGAIWAERLPRSGMRFAFTLAPPPAD
jgi:signal transduction histidine kinase